MANSTDGPAYYSAEMYISQNDDWLVPFVYQAVDPTTSATTPIDLTGSTLKLQIRRTETEKEAIVTVYSPNNGITIEDAVNGLFTVRIVRSTLLQLPPGTYVSDLVRLMVSGYQERIFAADVTVVQGTTR
jgi:hypothetical protein